MKSENPDVKHFASIPWCASHLAEPGVVRETSSSRFLKSNGEDALFSGTLNTPDTIKAFVTLYKLPPPETTNPLVKELSCLVALGPGVGGYPGVSHGGIVMTVVDEVLGEIFPVNKRHGLVPEGAYMTGYLNTQFLKPVEVPGEYLCRGWIERVEGRKFFLRGTVEDGQGTVLAKVDSLYIAVRKDFKL